MISRLLACFAAALSMGACAQASQPASKETEKMNAPTYSKAGFNVTPLTKQQVDELAKKLTTEESSVILAKGTEPAFCGNLLDNKKEGTYICRLCDLPLFSSDAKFDSGTGWPSFFKPYDTAHVKEIKDKSHGMVRTEILCARCEGHLGHVFDDGPRPTGLRFCLNSVSLTFVEKGQPMPQGATPMKLETAYFAGGCFWGVEDRFQQLPGVVEAVSGYMGGKVQKPTYKQICTTDTGHAETVKVVFDSSKISYPELLNRFFRFHDASQVDRQGPDVGTQYRSAIFTADESQAAAVKAAIDEQKAGRYARKGIATVVKPASEAGTFWEAEEYHQDYHLKNGGHCAMPPE